MKDKAMEVPAIRETIENGRGGWKWTYFGTSSGIEPLLRVMAEAPTYSKRTTGRHHCCSCSRETWTLTFKHGANRRAEVYIWNRFLSNCMGTLLRLNVIHYLFTAGLTKTNTAAAEVSSYTTDSTSNERSATRQQQMEQGVDKWKLSASIYILAFQIGVNYSSWWYLNS